VSFVLLFTVGDAGTGEYRKLEGYKQRLEENIAELERIHWQLEEELHSLATDPEKVRLLARDLGYYGSEDGIVRVVGRPDRSSFYRVGKIIEGTPARTPRALRLRLIGLVAPVISYLLMSAVRGWLRRGGKARSG